MSNYSKTTDFEAKDSLPTGDSGKIIRGAEFETEFDAISTAIATKADTAGPTFTGTLTFETISDGTIGVTAFVDEDNMASDSATLVPTQQSVKAYVDSQVTAQDLDFQADSGGALSIDLDSEALTLTGGTGIDTSGALNAVTFAIDSTVATLTGTQTLTNKTLTSPNINTPDIDGGTIDGTVIGGTTAAAVSATTVSATGNITVGGTVDGRDVAADGTKLDGIESGATADQTDAEIRAAVEAATDSNVFTDADHTKLNAIEANATADQTAAEIRTLVEAATDSNVFTDADHTKLNGIEASADVTDTTNVTAAGALMDSELTNLTAVKALDQGVATTDSPTFAGLTTTADVSFGDNDKAIFGAGSDLQIYHDGSRSYISDQGTGGVRILTNEFSIKSPDESESLFLSVQDGSAYLYNDNTIRLETTSTGIDVTGVITTDGMTTSADINFGDNDKAIFGAGSDLQIYHDGSNSFIRDVGTGNLKIQSDGTGIDLTKGATEFLATFAVDGAVTLYHDNSAKLATTSTGIDVTGTVVSDGLTVSTTGTTGGTITTADYGTFDLTNGTSTVRLQNNNSIPRVGSATNHPFVLASNEVQRIRLDTNGDISFYEDTGTTAKLFWDASLESLGIGTTSLTPTDGANIELSSSTSSRLLLDNTGASGRKYAITSDTSGNLGFYDYDASAFRILVNSSGNVGIGTSSPTFATGTGLQVTSGSFASVRVNHSGSTGLDVSQAGGGAGYLYLRDNADLIFGTNNTERMRINSSGQVSIGSSFASGVATRVLTVDDPSNAAIVVAHNGATALNLYADSDEANIGSYLQGANMKFFTTPSGGSVTERMRLDSSGNLLVGTTDVAPAVSSSEVGVAVSGSLGYVAASRSAGASGFFNRLSDGDIVNFNKSGTTVGSIGTQAGRLTVGSSSAAGVRFDGTQLVPMNGASISDNTITLGDSGFRFKDLYLSAGAYASFIAGQNDTNTSINFLGSDVITFNNGGSEAMRIDSSGNLLVGKTAANFTVAGHEIKPGGFAGFTRDGGAPIVATRLTSDGAIQEFYKDGTSVGSIGTSSADGFYIHSTFGNDSGLVFGSERIVPCTSTGVFEDGVQDLGYSSGRFKDLYLSGDVYLNNTNKTSIPSNLLSLIFNTSNTAVSNIVSGGYGGSHEHARFFHAGNNVGGIVTTTTATAYNTSSDYRLKENVVAMTGATERLKQLKPSRFNFIADADTTVDGFLAHEVQDVVPEAITGTKDGMRDEEYEVTPAVYDDDGNVVTEAVMGTRSVPDYQGIDQSKLVPLLVATIQELEARIAALESN